MMPTDHVAQVALVVIFGLVVIGAVRCVCLLVAGVADILHAKADAIRQNAGC